MRNLTCFILLFLFVSCGSVKKRTTYRAERKVTVEASKKTDSDKKPRESIANVSGSSSKAEEIIGTALTFSGTRYKYGGTTKKGMDCSGLLYVAFAEHDVQLPRISYQMAEEGQRIKVDHVEKGDLLFFRTNKRRKQINHVGMVVAIEGDEIKFIHASTSRGVIVSSLREGYWNYAFVKATRVL
ncbi:MAG: C40 family peptidase [Flavobacteriaceae bacterium]